MNILIGNFFFHLKDERLDFAWLLGLPVFFLFLLIPFSLSWSWFFLLPDFGSLFLDLISPPSNALSR